MKTLFLGDVSPKAENVKQFFRNGDADTLFADVQTIFKGNDINFVNLECALTEYETPIEKIGPPLKAPIETAQVLKKLGVTVCGVSNNHIFDYGIKGWNDTKNALEKAGIDYTGFGDNYEKARNNYVFTKDGESVCIIAVCEHEYSYALEDRMGSRPVDFNTFVDVKEAKEKYDRVIVIYHGGKECCPYPSPRLVQLYRALADMGADLILGQHSHCICSYEKYKDSHIFFGQGNFHFVWPNQPKSWYECLAVKYDTKTNDIEFIPIVINDNGVALANDEESKDIFSRSKILNDALANGTWKDGWSDYVETVREYYTSVIKEAYAADDEYYIKRFGHYIDCEAHTDIWKEFNKTANYTNEK